MSASTSSIAACWSGVSSYGNAASNSSKKVSRGEIQKYLGDPVQEDIDALATWREIGESWNTWFLRRPTGKEGDKVDQQWAEAIGEQKIFHIDDEQRAVDTAMGLIARAWGHFGDFRDNMRPSTSSPVESANSRTV